MEFRAGEQRVIARLMNDPVHILATGGGAFLDSQTRELVREKGISIWLRASLDLLVNRVSRRANRPLLKGGNQREILERLMEERYPVYEKADIVVDSGREPPEITADRVVGELQNYMDPEGVEANHP
jgi:shikimate kinase